MANQRAAAESTANLLTPFPAIVVGNYLYIDGGEITTWDGSGDGLISIYEYFNTTGNINTTPGQHPHCPQHYSLT